MKLLSICIPTYNRPYELKNLNDSFLSKILDVYGESVEILICDNSDEAICEINRNIISKNIKYEKNGMNIGAPRNHLKCAQIASGEYIWFLSDDDKVIWHGFERLMLELQKRKVDCFLAPFITKNYYNEIYEERYQFLNNNIPYKLSDVLSWKNNFLPFGLISSGIVRLNKSSIEEIRNNLSSNLFIQIALFLTMLKESSTVQVLPVALIDYKVEYDTRLSAIDVFDSVIGLIEYLSPKFESIRSNRIDLVKREYKNVAFLLLRNNSGLCKIHQTEGIRSKFFVRLIKYANIKNIILFLIILLPKSVSGRIYMYYAAWDYANRKNERGVISWFNKFGEGVSNMYRVKLLLTSNAFIENKTSIE